MSLTIVVGQLVKNKHKTDRLILTANNPMPGYYITDESWSDQEARTQSYLDWLTRAERTEKARRRTSVEAHIVPQLNHIIPSRSAASTRRRGPSLDQL